MGMNCLLPFAFLFLISGSMVCLAIHKNNMTDQSALLALKAQITSDPFKIISTSWSKANPLCQWVGVTCSARHHRVIALDLSNMHLKGTIPHHLGNLSFLVSIKLSNNSFDGAIPIDQLARLRRLKVIDLGGNNFREGIPPNLAILPRLEQLLLYNNSLTGTIPPTIFNITTLKVLVLADNFLKGNIPEEIGNLSNMEILRMGFNQFSGAIPAVIFNMSSLKVISLVANNLSSSLQDFVCGQDSKLEWLNLSRNQLYGHVPSNLYMCAEIQLMSLSFNRFTGSIPREIGNVTKLTDLHLAENDLEGEIPDEIAHLSGLQTLVLYGNKLQGSIPSKIANCASLRGIYLDRNNLTGSMPKELGNCTWLQEINARDNQLIGMIPSDFGKLHNLQMLHLGSNRLSGAIPSTIFNLSMMRNIDLTSNHFSGHLPSDIGLRLPNLERLDLSQNQLSGPIPNSISNASQLIDLGLAVNSFSGFIPHSLGNLRNLERLTLWDNLLTTNPSTPELSFLSTLANCKHLEYLALDRNPLNTRLPISIGNLSVSQFFATSCKLKGPIPQEIGNWSNLIALNLQNNDLIGTIPSTFGNLWNLQGMSLNGNKLQGSIPHELCNLENVGYFYFANNRLLGSLPACLGNLTSLRYLSLAFNRLTGTIPSTLWKLQDISSVNLSSNYLSGSLSLEMAKVLIVLDLSRNELSGGIPSGIGGLGFLQFLYLDNNRLDGYIPRSFGDLVSLEYVDLSSNNLSGVIPKTLEKLIYLKYFNVSNNKLRGLVPDSGPFANFSAESFLGNEALCGSTRMLLPPCNGTVDRPSKAKIYILKLLLPIIGFVVLLLAFVVIFIRKRRRNAMVSTQGRLSLLTTWTRISYHELEVSTNGFDESNLLGRGSFGSVYKVTLSDGMTVAVKVFNLQLEGGFTSFDTECEILRYLRHRNLVKILSSCCTPDFKALILEYMANWSLEKWLYSHNYFLDCIERLNIVIDVASALEYLHYSCTAPVVHCDLKPSNVLLDDERIAHLSDFGIAKLLGEGDSMTRTMTLATIGYMAPEYGSEGIVSIKGDVYSYGILMMETFTRTKPTDEKFLGETSLKHWIEQSLPLGVAQVIDANLLRIEEEHLEAKKECITSILELALECSADSLEDRKNMKDVVVALKKIREKFLKYMQSD